MAAEIRLSDGTTLKTFPNVSADDLTQTVGRSLIDFGNGVLFPLLAEDGETYRVNPEQVVFVRDVQ